MSAVISTLSAPPAPAHAGLWLHCHEDAGSESDAKQTCEQLLAGEIDVGMRSAVALLDRLSSAAGVSAAIGAEVTPSLGRLLRVLQQNPLVSWNLAQPYGYPADPQFMDLALGLAPLDPKSTALGAAMQGWMLEHSAICSALHRRRDYLAGCIDNIPSGEAECRAVSLFGGYAREFDASARFRAGSVSACLVDFDTRVLARAASSAPDHERVGRIQTCQASLGDLLSGQIRLYDCSLLYVSSLPQFLDPTTLGQLLQSLVDWLRPGGEIVVAAFESVPEAGFLELAAGWQPNCLSRPELLGLARDLAGVDARVHVETEAQLAYLHVRRL